MQLVDSEKQLFHQTNRVLMSPNMDNKTKNDKYRENGAKWSREIRRITAKQKLEDIEQPLQTK